MGDNVEHAPTHARCSTTIALLSSYYPVVRSLESHLKEILQLEKGGLNFLILQSDPQSYKNLLRGSYVTQSGRPAVARRFEQFPSMVNMREVMLRAHAAKTKVELPLQMIDRAHERLFTRFKGRPTNVIASGYHTATRNGAATTGKVGMTRLAITNFYVNTNITALQAPEWELLHSRVGDDVVLHLLTETSVFLPLPNDCLCQVVGEPIIYLKPPPMILRRPPLNDDPLAKQDHNAPPHRGTLKRKRNAPHPDERPPKRLRMSSGILSAFSSLNTQSSKSRGLSQCFTPADIVLSRSRIFYSRAHYIPHTDKIAIGLPPKHIMNRIGPSYHEKQQSDPGSWKDPDPRVQAENARHLARYIFPRQYGLSSPFVHPARQSFGLHGQPDYSDREVEIKARGTCKTPKRLRNVLSDLDKMLWRHEKCRYKALLEMACSSKVKNEEKEILDSSMIFEMMTETSIMLQTQASVSNPDISMDTTRRSSIARGISQLRRQTKQKPRFAEFTCTFSEVYRYVALVTNAVIPDAMWGSRRNKKLVLQHVRTFITSRRYETTTLHNIVQGFRVTDCDWLLPTGSQANQARSSASDAMKRQELLEEFLFWYFDGFVVPLLKATFYVTESSALRQRVLYFRQDDWAILCAPLIDKLSTDMFEKLEHHDAQEILRQRKLGYSFVRLLPKETGVRPIVNLRRRTAKKEPFARPQQSINQILQAAFQILTFEKENRPHLLGCSVFGSNEIYAKLKAFKMRLLSDRPDGKLPKLYFVKVDVQACFDTIDQTRLLQILRDLLSEEDYMIQRYGQVGCAGSKIRRKYAKKARTEADHPHFLAQAAQIAEAFRNTIFVDQVVYSFAKKQEVVQLLEEHITENIVKIGSDYYRQVVGIPQGSVLSALLCSFFYGDLEHHKLKFADDPQSLLLRLIDDYLLVTTSLPRARHFLDVMNEGHPDYGCFVSQEKTRTNFEHVTLANVVEPHQRSFPWCGYMIDMSDLSVSADYSRYHETYLEDSLTVANGRNPGVTFAHKMLQSIKGKSHILFCDADLNTERTVHLNIYQNFLLSAMKMHYYLRHWGINLERSSDFVRKIVRQTIRYAYVAMRNWASNKIARANQGRCHVQESDVVWLGTHAFVTVLLKKPRAYKPLLAKLQFELSLPRYRRFKKRFRGVITEGLVLLDLLAF